MAKGSAKSFDHRDLIHEMWTQAVACDMSLWVQRVSTDLNIADLPSRGSFTALHKVNARYREPILIGPCWAAEAWSHWRQAAGG